MKRLLPTSMAGWLILVIVVGLVLSQAITIAIHYNSRRDAQLLLENVRIVERVVALTRIIYLLPLEQRPDIAVGVSHSGLIVTWEPKAAVNISKSRNDRAQLLAEVLDRRHEELPLRSIEADYFPGPISLPLASDLFNRVFNERNNDLRGSLRQVVDRNSEHGIYVVSLQLADSTWVNIAAPDIETVPAWSSATIALVVATMVIVIGLSIVGIRHLTAPLSTLTRAADRLGRNVNSPPLQESGSADVIQAIRAFNGMQDRIRKFVEDRTRMIAAISHDLRTPITRLRLRAELIGDSEQQQKMLADLSEMETMIASTLNFAREDANPEPRHEIDLRRLLQAICADLPGAELVSVDVPGNGAILEGQPVALRRGFTNLIDNAIRYGKRARVSVAAGDGGFVAHIEDEGQGIPQEELEKVFKPFYRLESSRSRDTGGTGLGLSVARTVFRAHGGDVTLSNLPEGGLRATVTLPYRKD